MKVITINMHKDKYQGLPWIALSEFQKRKYENLLFLQNMNQEREYVRFVYV